MRTRIKSADEEGNESINVSPLIDVVFILLIFFIVSATFVSLPGVEISRVRTETAKSLERNSILFALSDEDEIYHGGKKVNLQDVPGLIEKASKDRKKPVVIQVDQWADATIMAKLVAEAGKNSNSVSIATRKPK
ncbi:MAG: biopolymer transporter ExbD [Opitutae bacterium]|jgi:biopolymer transport protein ExbD|nr:biopolymer transporter ExbD [Opitutae bacterium]